MRRTDLDALRILFCASVICSHALLIFAFEPRYHIKSPETSFVASVLFEFIHATTMPAFMLIAGWAAVRSLRGRSPGQFLWERVKRLFVPLVFGVATFGSVIKYLELADGRDMGLAGFRPADTFEVLLKLHRPATFLDFLPRYLSRTNLLTWSHLWFLAYLFVFSVLLLPVLLSLARRVPRESVPSAFVVYIPGLLLVALLVGLGGYWPFLPRLIGDWGNLSFYGLCFLFGAVIAAWPGFEVRLRAQAPLFVVLMLGAFAGLIVYGESTIGRICAGLTAWGGTATALSFAARFSPRPSPALAWLSEAALPIYIIHHAPLLLIAVAVLPLALPLAVKIVIIWMGATAVSLLAYQWLIRPWPPMRFLMGMQAQPALAPTPVAAAPSAL
ncbi:MAG: acyltransferase family protein [Xanthobacteraceae bacterium]